MEVPQKLREGVEAEVGRRGCGWMQNVEAENWWTAEDDCGDVEADAGCRGC